MKIILTRLIFWVAAVSLSCFVLMGVDKGKSHRKGARRVPEKVFFLLALLGGSPGVLWGMLVFRHKTRHWYFAWGIPLMLCAQVALLLWAVHTFPA